MSGEMACVLPDVVGASDADPANKQDTSAEVVVSVEISCPAATLKHGLKAWRHPFAWVLITATVAVLAAVAMQPVWCPSDEKCQASVRKDPVEYNEYAAFALGALFIHEVASLSLTWKMARQAMHIIHNIRDFMIPGVFLCVTFAVLLIENLAMMNTTKWHAHTARGAPHLESEPVYTVFYIEWLINVPILLILAGRYALSTPLDEVARPLVITNIYIIFAWAGYFVEDFTLRVFVVASAFILYFFASVDMVKWVRKFYAKGSAEEMGYLRPFLAVALIVVFGIYGLVYLFRLLGVVSSKSEWLFFLIMNSVTKLLASIAFAGIRSAEYHSLLLDMVCNTNTVFQRELTEDKCLIEA